MVKCQGCLLNLSGFESLGLKNDNKFWSHGYGIVQYENPPFKQESHSSLLRFSNCLQNDVKNF